MTTRRMDPIERLSVAVAAVLVLFGAVPLGAQEPNPFGPLAVFQMADRQDWVMRASLSNGAEVVGRILDVDARSARLEGGQVPFAQLVLLERGERHGGGILKGAVIGGVILGGLAALVLYVIPGGDSDADENDVALGITAAAGAGALVGGIVGGWLSPPGTSWMPIWPADATE